jgi:hypothetical protein
VITCSEGFFSAPLLAAGHPPPRLRPASPSATPRHAREGGRERSTDGVGEAGWQSEGFFSAPLLAAGHPPPRLVRLRASLRYALTSRLRLRRDKHAREGQIRGRVRVGRDIPVGAAEVPPSLAAGHPSPAARAHAREGESRASGGCPRWRAEPKRAAMGDCTRGLRRDAERASELSAHSPVHGAR